MQPPAHGANFAFQALAGISAKEDATMEILHELSAAVPASYAEHTMNSLEVWALLIAAALVLLEWLASRR